MDELMKGLNLPQDFDELEQYCQALSTPDLRRLRDRVMSTLQGIEVEIKLKNEEYLRLRHTDQETRVYLGWKAQTMKAHRALSDQYRSIRRVLEERQTTASGAAG